ncbi:hypothetical protein BDA99DRAFT_492589 [Phascolomyces articulosus]|uniref:PH domain-containing protein n=1 Tax=Phascolomyces articulosus TaxID=60185 RepID=A0AAD5KCT2_9FUNG|nr:hypothetical protein BDA99DRAFT_492589 [Phascolomyces articulosus]
MGEVKKRNSFTSFGLRILGRSNSTGKKPSSSRPPTTTSNQNYNTRRRTHSSASSAQQQPMSSSNRLKENSNGHLARGNSIKSNNNNTLLAATTTYDITTTQQQVPKNDSHMDTTTATKDNNNSKDEPLNENITHEEKILDEEVPKSPTTASPSDVPEELEYANISAINIQQQPGSANASRNRAQAIIQRLGAWQLILREILIWLEQVGKINMQSSELYYHKVLPHVDWKDKHIKQDTPMSSLLSGFRSLTSRVATTQQSAGNKLFKEYIPDLQMLARDCKQRIQTLDQSRQFRMDELLKRAETTQKTIALLSKQCQAAANATGNGPLAQDPWVTNLHVLRYLQREVHEDNRLRATMIDVQHQSALFEKRVIHTLKKTMQFCYDHYGNIATSRETARMQRMIEKMDTEREWQQFLNSEAKDLVVDALNPTRNYLHINYNNKFHPAVMTLYKGLLGRRTGVRKQYTARYFVLTQCGFLHQFHENDKVNPELSIFIPKATIVPSIDISHLANTSGISRSGGGGGGGNSDYTFEIRRGGSGALQRDKIYVLRANSREELITWCRLLVDIATRTHGLQSSAWKKIQRKSTTLLTNEDPMVGGGEMKVDTTNKTAAVHRSISNASSKYTNIKVSHGPTSPLSPQSPAPPPLSPAPPVVATNTSPISPTPEQQDPLAKARTRITSIIDDYNDDQQKKSHLDDHNKEDDSDDDDNDSPYLIPPTARDYNTVSATDGITKQDKGKTQSNEEIITLKPTIYPSFEEQENQQQPRYYNTDSKVEMIDIPKEQHQPKRTNVSNNNMTVETTAIGVVIEDEDQKTPTKESMPVFHHAITTDTPIHAAGSVERHDIKQEVADSTTSTSTEKKNDIPVQQQPSTIMTSFASYLPQLTAFSPTSAQQQDDEQQQQQKKEESTISIASSQTFESFPPQSSSEDIINTSSLSQQQQKS